MIENIVETKCCKQCSNNFGITEGDIEFYKKISPLFNGKKIAIPHPSLCPDCRNQKRLSFFNYRSLYKNVCNHCSKQMIARFPETSTYKVLCLECWSRSKMDSLDKGGEIDFSKSVFDHMRMLVKDTSYQSLIGALSNVTNNAGYTNHTSEIKDSYLIFEANTIESSYYGFGLKNSKNVIDSSFSGNNQYLYECIDCYEMYNCFYSKRSFGSKFSYFLEDCTSCSYCIGCSNLSNKQYYILNKESTEEEYNKLKEKLTSRNYLVEFTKEFEIFCQKMPKKFANIVSSEDVSGNNIINSNKCYNSYDVLESENCKYVQQINYSQNVFDVSSYGEKSWLMYESVSVGRYSNNILFSSIIGKGDHLIYCIETKKSKNCFGCVNIKEKEYCIFNKQYTKDEYEEFVPQIITHMQKTGEWGEFFSSDISPFGYNETVASEYFTLSKKEALEQGFNWSDYETPKPNVEKLIPASKIPDTIKDIPDDILNWAIECEETQKPFRIIKQELDFYRKHNLPIPIRHPDQRHLDRMKLRNPKKLYVRSCDKCEKEIKTTYSPERPEKVYCEECYNTAVK